MLFLISLIFLNLVADVAGDHIPLILLKSDLQRMPQITI